MDFNNFLKVGWIELGPQVLSLNPSLADLGQGRAGRCHAWEQEGHLCL